MLALLYSVVFYLPSASVDFSTDTLSDTHVHFFIYFSVFVVGCLYFESVQAVSILSLSLSFSGISLPVYRIRACEKFHNKVVELFFIA